MRPKKITPSTPLSPARPANPPGQPALAYRLGTHASFLERMLDRLRAQSIPVDPDGTARPLSALSTRETDDPAIALLDAWAMVADVITFYQERIANEGFLRTATERRSLLELGRAVGYELNPGVAASAFLAFSVEEAPGAPTAVEVPKGTGVQSVPRPGSQPQTFETMEPLTARVEWNALKPQLTGPAQLSDSAMELRLKGIHTRLAPGDVLLIQAGGSPKDDWCLVTLQAVEAHAQAGYTLARWADPPLGTQGSIAGPDPHVFAFRQQAALFGHNAPEKDEPGAVAADAREIDLDAPYPQILPGGWVALADGEHVRVYEVKGASTVWQAGFSLSSRVTRLTLDQPTGVELGRRSTSIYAQSEKLELAEQLMVEVLSGNSLTLDRRVPELEAGKRLILSGRLADGSDDAGGEGIIVEQVGEENERTVLTLKSDLRNTYFRASVTLYGNVVLATHGETVAEEILGSGDGSQTNQRFRLNVSPLTYLPAPTSRGSESALEVRVDGVLWRETASFHDLAANDQRYTLRRDEAGRTSVIFGDGRSGARLPSGQENVSATYRSGLGLQGNVDAGRLSLLKNRPAGIREVTNPVPASGGAAPETADRARDHVPRAVLALQRLVSLQDYEDYARNFAGVGKAQATSMWTGETRLIHLTIADAAGSDYVDPESALVESLYQALRRLGNPLQRVRIDSYSKSFFQIQASLIIDPPYQAREVIRAVEAALREAFCFERREFGQAVSAAEIIATMQSVAGVVAVDLDVFNYSFLNDPAVVAIVPANPATIDPNQEGVIYGAELLLLMQDSLLISEKAT